MATAINVLRWILRLGFLAALALGITLWTGHGYSLLHLHMWIGFIITFALLFIVILGLLAKVNAALPLIALVWAVALPTIGIAQLHIMPGASHWVIQVVHLILGLGAICLGEVLCKKTLLVARP